MTAFFLQFLSLLRMPLDCILSILSSERLTPLFGAPLIWIFFSFMVVWTILNIFVFRSSISPGLVSKVAGSKSGGRHAYTVDRSTGEVIDE